MTDVAYSPRYTIADYLGWEGDWELWNGQAVAMSPSPGFRHQALASRLHLQLAEALRDTPDCGDCLVLFEIDWHVDDGTVVRPDLLILCGDPPEEYVKRPPVFVSEILSPATAEKDRTAKRALYEARGVKYYLMADPEEKTCVLLRLGEEGTYRECPPGSSMELHPGCAVSLLSEELFG